MVEESLKRTYKLKLQSLTFYKLYIFILYFSTLYMYVCVHVYISSHQVFLYSILSTVLIAKTIFSTV